jgi:hypothetical protein
MAFGNPTRYIQVRIQFATVDATGRMIIDTRAMLTLPTHFARIFSLWDAA